MLAERPNSNHTAPLDEDAADDAAMVEYEAQGGISHEAIRAWVLSWGTEAELPRPQIGD